MSDRNYHTTQLPNTERMTRYNFTRNWLSKGHPKLAAYTVSSESWHPRTLSSPVNTLHQPWLTRWLWQKEGGQLGTHSLVWKRAPSIAWTYDEIRWDTLPICAVRMISDHTDLFSSPFTMCQTFLESWSALQDTNLLCCDILDCPVLLSPSVYDSTNGSARISNQLSELASNECKIVLDLYQYV